MNTLPEILFPNREYRPILRLYIPHWNRDAVVADTLRYMDETGIRDLLLFSDAQFLVWNQLSDAEIEVECAALTEAVKVFRAHHVRTVGLNTSIMQMASRADHRTHEDYDYYLTDGEGKTEYRLPCPMDPKLLRYIDRFYTALAATNPDYIYMDDDLRYMYTDSRSTFGCCCPLHLAKFGKISGREWTPQSLQRALCEDFALRKQYIAFLGDSLNAIASRIRAAVKKTNPAIRLGLMIPCTHTVPVSGSRIKDVVETICGNDRMLTRPCIGPYDDYDRKMVLAGLFHMELTRHILGKAVDYTPEIEVAPSTSVGKTPTVARFYMIQGILNGMPAPLFSPVGYCGDTPYLDLKFPKMLQTSRPYFEALTKIAPAPESRKGIGLFSDVTAATAYEEQIASPYDLFFPCCAVHNILDTAGLAHTYEDAPAAFLCGIHAAPLSPGKTLELLGKTLIIDAHAAQMLCNKGFGKLLGISEMRPAPAFCGSELALSQAYFGRYAHSYISIRETPLTKIRVPEPLPGAEILSEFVNHDLKPVAPGAIVFHNELGGNVLVLPYSIDESVVGGSAYPLISLHRQRMLHEFVKRFAPELMPVELPEGAETAVQYWREKERITLALTNFAYDVVNSLPLASALPLNRATVLEEDGSMRPVRISGGELQETLLPFRPLIMQAEVDMVENFSTID